MEGECEGKYGTRCSFKEKICHRLFHVLNIGVIANVHESDMFNLLKC